MAPPLWTMLGLALIGAAVMGAIIDALTTGWAVRRFGLDCETNPLIRILIRKVGLVLTGVLLCLAAVGLATLAIQVQGEALAAAVALIFWMPAVSNLLVLSAARNRDRGKRP